MVERWEPCSECVDHCYQVHKLANVPKKRFCFFKVLLGKFDKQLRIPPAFLKHLEHEHSNKLILQGPSGKLWHMTLERTNNRMILQNGWEKFVKDHSLELGDLLVFRYNGGLHFTVQIFDRTACEKEDLFGFGYGEEPNFYKANEEQKEVKENPVQEFHAPQSKFLKSKAQKMDVRERPSGSKNVYSAKEKPVMVTKNFAGKPISSKVSSKDKGVRSMCDYQMGHYVSTRGAMTEEQRERVYEATNSFRSSKPCFMLVMKPSQVYAGFCLVIPSYFAENYLSHDSKLITLGDPSGRRWPVRCLWTDKKGARFGRGWRRFSLMNNLEEGDACIFELVDDCNFDVHIFRVVDTTQPLIPCGLHSTR